MSTSSIIKTIYIIFNIEMILRNTDTLYNVTYAKETFIFGFN